MDMVPDWIDRLDHVVSTGKGFEARCPAHQDKNPSLAIDPGGKGWLIHCHRGCDTHAVMAAIGLSMRDLYYNSKEYKAPSDPSKLDAKAFFDKAAPWTPCTKLHTFNDVAFEAMGFPVDLAWAEAMVSVYPYGADRFDTTMGMWIVLRDDWLWTWLGKLWSEKDGPKKDWREVTEWAASRMWTKWITQGCSTCPLEESRKPVLGLG